jgi:hypothetical protein
MMRKKSVRIDREANRDATNLFRFCVDNTPRYRERWYRSQEANRSLIESTNKERSGSLHNLCQRKKTKDRNQQS